MLVAGTVKIRQKLTKGPSSLVLANISGKKRILTLTALQMVSRKATSESPFVLHQDLIDLPAPLLVPVLLTSLIYMTQCSVRERSLCQMAAYTCWDVEAGTAGGLARGKQLVGCSIPSAPHTGLLGEVIDPRGQA